MTHDQRLATAEEIMNGKDPFEKVSTPLGEMERWRAEAMLIGTTSGIENVYRTIRADAATEAARADAEQAREALITHVCDQITELATRFDALEARLNEAEDKRRSDEQAQRKFEEEPLTLPPDIAEYQASTPPAEIGDEEHQPGCDLHTIGPSQDPEPDLEVEDDNIGDLPKELEEPPDPVPEPKGSVVHQPVSNSLNKE